MNLFMPMLTILVLLASVSTAAQTVMIERAGSRPVRPGPAENFTGGVRVERLFEAVDPSHASGGSVTFDPGARTAWHTHPRGQILIVTAGVGRVQEWGDSVEEIRSGDVVRIPAGQKHWHGASPREAMAHIAITEHRDGTVVEWMEQVSDEQYNVAPPSPKGGPRAPAPPSVQPDPATQPPIQRQVTTSGRALEVSAMRIGERVSKRGVEKRRNEERRDSRPHTCPPGIL